MLVLALGHLLDELPRTGTLFKICITAHPSLSDGILFDFDNTSSSAIPAAFSRFRAAAPSRILSRCRQLPRERNIS
jgi:hypothetical protein